MEWGSYLCRGMMKTASKSTQEPRLSDPAHQALMLRLQRCLMHFGMTPFSSRVLMQHMMVNSWFCFVSTTKTVYCQIQLIELFGQE